MIKKSRFPKKRSLLFLFSIPLLFLYSCTKPEKGPEFKERLVYVRDGIIHVEGTVDQTHTRVGRGSDPSLSFDGRYIAYVNVVGHKQRISILDFPNRSTHVIEDVQGTSWHPLWSPTENRFLFSVKVDNNGSSYRAAIVGHTREQKKYVITREDVNILSPAWAFDGESVYAHDTRFLYQFEPTGMLLGHSVLSEKFGRLEYNESTIILPSPDGNFWLIGIGSEEPLGTPRKTSMMLYLFDEINQSLTGISPKEIFISSFSWSSNSRGAVLSGKSSPGQKEDDVFLLSIKDGSMTRLVKNATQASCRAIQLIPKEGQQ